MTHPTINDVLAALPRSKRAPFITAIIDVSADDVPATLRAWAQQAAGEPAAVEDGTNRDDTDRPSYSPELAYRDTSSDDDELEAEHPGGTITVEMYLDGPREYTRPKPDNWADLTADQRCAVIDRIKWELLGDTVAFNVSGTFNRSGHDMPCNVDPRLRSHQG